MLLEKKLMRGEAHTLWGRRIPRPLLSPAAPPVPGLEGYNLRKLPPAGANLNVET